MQHTTRRVIRAFVQDPLHDRPSSLEGFNRFLVIVHEQINDSL